MPNPIDMAGQRYGRLLVIEQAPEYTSPRTIGRRRLRRRWTCQCDCGNTITAFADNLRSGHTISCGCFRQETSAKLNYSHGHTSKGKSIEYRCWRNMKVRCGMTAYVNKPDSRNFRGYEGRGFTMCKRWLKFKSFLADMGPAPGPGYSIERKNNNAGYKPSNCTWLPMRDQGKNTRTNVKLTFKGETKILADWARILNIKYTTLGRRIRAGWPVKRALTTPAGPSYRKHAAPPK